MRRMTFKRAAWNASRRAGSHVANHVARKSRYTTPSPKYGPSEFGANIVLGLALMGLFAIPLIIFKILEAIFS